MRRFVVISVQPGLVRVDSTQTLPSPTVFDNVADALFRAGELASQGKSNIVVAEELYRIETHITTVAVTA